MKALHFEIKNNGDSAITIVFNLPASELLTRQIIALRQVIQEKFAADFIELIPAYQSLTLCFDPLTINLEELQRCLENLIPTIQPVEQDVGRLIEVPVCYAPEFGFDLETVASHCRLSVKELIRRHSEAEYLVHMLGFTPGFLYLGGLPESLNCPRKTQPAKSVPAGSVGIGGAQTGIYPQQSPGGWQIIGRTPINIFQPEAKNPYLATPLDKIKFIPIAESEFWKKTQYDQVKADRQ